MRLCRFLLTVSLLSIVVECAAPGVAWSSPPEPSLRRPIALTLVDEGRRLIVANRDRGTLSEIDTQSKQLTNEVAVAGRIEHMTATQSGGLLLVVDGGKHQLTVASTDSLKRLGSVGVPRYPVEVCCSIDGKSAAVASLWSRQVALISLDDPRAPVLRKKLDLPLAPRKMLMLPDQSTLLIADSFGGRLAIVNTITGSLVGTRTLAGHNIRGLALAADKRTVLLSHQMLSPHYGTTRSSVHWGDIMSNVIRTVSVADIGDASSAENTTRRLPTAGSVYYLGYPDRATGDPGDVAATVDRRQVVVYSGVDEIAVSDPDPPILIAFVSVAGRSPWRWTSGATEPMWPTCSMILFLRSSYIR